MEVRGAGELSLGVSTSQLPTPGTWWPSSLILSLPLLPHFPSYKALASVHLASSPHYQSSQDTPYLPPHAAPASLLCLPPTLVHAVLHEVSTLQNLNGAPHPVTLPCLKPCVGL